MKGLLIHHGMIWLLKKLINFYKFSYVQHAWKTTSKLFIEQKKKKHRYNVFVYKIFKKN